MATESHCRWYLELLKLVTKRTTAASYKTTIGHAGYFMTKQPFPWQAFERQIELHCKLLVGVQIG
jgi:hypothetical protein